MNKLTKKQKSDYLKNSGKCPYCKSDQIEGGSIEIDGETAWQTVSCLNCDKKWNDIYRLANVEEVE